METNIKAVWQGNFKQGKGVLKSGNSPINDISFKPFFAKNDGSFSNPEELLASSHATCYTLTLAYILSENGFMADDIETTVSLVINNNKITHSNLNVKAKIARIEHNTFQQFSEKAKGMCLIGNALKVESNLVAILIE